ncbi:hypothetical protein GI374_01200 [Paracoccus sp. S-4012]|uniref:hypothetical protein n=1 Tax=Paracoccus sp. S-4012 TaxID=2665648 RepID=UPI0012B03FDF|nr:hypothetical protein [Paracoccus sp. S-4012]MRX49075.1 hypothetical protein [Paracoccus sp. S-4012]
MTPRTRFVIFSSARSGTSLVTATLGQHPDIYCHAEIFQAKRENHILKEFRAAHDVEGLAKTPVKLARAVLDFTPGPPVVGFKMWTWQAPAAAREILADPGLRKIVIERKNRLAAYSSVRLAFTTGVWNLWPGEGRKAAPPLLPFDAADFEAFLKRQQKLFDEYRAHAAGELLEVAYGELPDPGIARIQAFLGVAPRDLAPRRQKLHSDDILARFAPEARDAVRAAVERAGHPEWLREARG